MEMRGAAVSAMSDPGTILIEDINWKVARGDFWVVAGLQGSGKTDLLMMAAGVTPPAGGKYWLFGSEMPLFEDADLPTRLRLGMVFDRGQLFHHLTVAENVALPLQYHRNLSMDETAPEVKRLLEIVGLTEWADSSPSSLSTNWQKRVGFARALILRPDVLLLDNPMGGLDLRNANWWLEFLDGLSRGDGPLGGPPVTLVVTANDLRAWAGPARKFAMLRKRSFTLCGGWDQLQSAGEEVLGDLLPAANRT